MAYLSPEEEYDMLYADELEAIKEMESMLVADNIQTSTVMNGIGPPHADCERIQDIECSDVRKTISSTILSQTKRSLSDEEENLYEKKRRKVYEDGSIKVQVEDNIRMHIEKPLSMIKKNSSSVPIPLTQFDGTVVYLNFYEDTDLEVLSFSKNTSRLLSTPIADLKMEVFKKDFATFDSEDQKTVSSGKSVLKARKNRKRGEKCDLWVEKYRPKSFVDLLSDEGVNRLLLHWLKLWDKVVFGRELKNFKRAKPAVQSKFSKFRKPHMELVEDLDEHDRPKQKIVLLCGPPGLGKTTLATIIAHHAGYNVVELNASDDRSPDIFRSNLEAATQMKAVLDKENRPNCLVIDEIDGAPAPSINLLVTYVKSTGYTKGKKKKGEIPLLMRPIICICNDQYVPALKTLRQVALILKFPPTSKNRLAARLYEVAIMEDVKTDLSSLCLLCEKADNDIRSCISTIQFLCSLKGEIRSADIQKIEIGQKDLQKSLFSVWHDIFYVPKVKMGRVRVDYESGKSVLEIDEAVLRKRFSDILRVVQTYGEYEKLYIGVFENFLNIKFRLTHINILYQGPDWMCFGDYIQQNIMQNQLFFLMPYLPYVGVAFHLLYASSAYPQLSYPSSYYECKTKRSQLLNVLSSMVNEVVVSVKSFFNVNCLVLDILPMLSEIIKPNLRPITTQLYTDYEKAELKQVVDVMIAFGLSYRQERSVEGQYNYVLEPNIEELVQFSGLKRTKILEYGTKQLISHEVTIEKLRRSEPVIILDKKKEKEKSFIIKPEKNINEKKPYFDFFGRKLDVPAKKVNQVLEPEVPVEECLKMPDDVWYHFKEGFSNAVRKIVYVKDFL